VRELRGVGAVTERQGIVLLAAAHDRRKLEEIADQHDLHAAERRGHALDVTADCFDQREAVRRSIEISSMISTCVRSMRAATRRFRAIASRSRFVSASRTPIPLQAWMVIPLPCVAAMPVEAV
jgi:hypothetical protein